MDELNAGMNETVPKLPNASAYFKRYEFINSKTEVALPCLLILVLATAVGTFGNVLILLSVLSRKNLRKVEGIFIVNLASSDLYVTAIADPMSIVGKFNIVEYIFYKHVLILYTLGFYW